MSCCASGRRRGRPSCSSPIASRKPSISPTRSPSCRRARAASWTCCRCSCRGRGPMRCCRATRSDRCVTASGVTSGNRREAVMKASTLRWLIVITLISLWEILPRAGVIPELFLPSLSSTLAAGWNEAGEYGQALAVTLYEVAISMAFACGGGILLGAIVGSLPRPRVLIMPMVSSLYAVPLVILYPVFTVWLGIGSESKIAFASIYGFLPTMLATAAGIQTIDPQLLLAARSMGATLSQRVTRVIIPAAIPTVLSGLRVGGALVIVGVVVSEMLISSAGIGYLISRYRTILDSPHVFAGVLLVLAMAIGFNAIIRLIERRCAIWQTGTRGGQSAAEDIAPGALAPAT